MSYDRYTTNFIIRFKDEESYLEAKLENLKSFPDVPFIGFIRERMYNIEKCEVESIEQLQYSISHTSFNINCNMIIRGNLNNISDDTKNMLKAGHKNILEEDSKDTIESRFDILDL